MEKQLNFGWTLPDDAIAVKRVEDEKKSPGGIIIPDTAQEKANEGIIIALGAGIHADEETGYRKGNCPYFIGQRIKFGKYSGSEMKGDDGEEYILMREHDILAYKNFVTVALEDQSPLRKEDVIYPFTYLRP